MLVLTARGLIEYGPVNKRGKRNFPFCARRRKKERVWTSLISLPATVHIEQTGSVGRCGNRPDSLRGPNWIWGWGRGERLFLGVIRVSVTVDLHAFFH